MTDTAPPSTWGVITARSLRQAKDWSLVLASQGIDHELHKKEAGFGGELWVQAAELSRARELIGVYLRENRHRRWRVSVKKAGLVFDWQSLGWVVLIGIFYLLQTFERSPLVRSGEFATEAVRHGEWWRSITAVWLHADLRHLASNATTGLVFLGLAMAEYGAGPALLGALIAGAAANGLGLLLRPITYFGLGSSGMVMAALGMLAVRAFRLREWRERPGAATSRGLLAGLFLLILFGFSPESDVVVHVSGFVVGAVIGLIMTPLAHRPNLQLDWDVPCKLAFLLTLSLSWWRALS